jgi:hypothetical protein
VSLRKLHHATGFDPATLRRAAAERATSYRPFHNTKPGGKSRHIDNPVGLLKAIQKSLVRNVLSEWSAPPEMFGAVPGRTARDNAMAHLEAPVLAKLDIKQCYPSISEAQVASALARSLGCSSEIASLLAALTTVNDHLPQGAPTSSSIANMVLKPYLDALRARLAPLGVGVVTMFVDDVGLSGARAREALGVAIRLLHAHGFRVSPDKIDVMANHREAQTLTGFTVNRALPGGAVSVGRARTKRYRGEILRAARSPDPTQAELSRAHHHARWVKSVSPKQGEPLERLALRMLPEHGRLGEAIFRGRSPCTCELGAGLGPRRDSQHGRGHGPALCPSDAPSGHLGERLTELTERGRPGP